MDLLMIRWSDNGVARSAAKQAAFCWSWHCVCKSKSKSKRNWHIWRQTNKQTHTLMPTTYTFIIYHIIEEWTNTAAVAVLRSLRFSMTKLTPSSATSSPLNTHSRLSCGMFNISIQSSRAMVHNVYCTCRSLPPSLAFWNNDEQHSVAIYLRLQCMPASRYPISLAWAR